MRQKSFVKQAQNNIRNFRVKLPASPLADFRGNIILRLRRAVCTHACHRIVCVCHTDNAPFEANRVAAQSARIACPVIPLVMFVYSAANMGDCRNILHNIRTDSGVRLNNFILCLGQLARLFQNFVGNTDFADVVQQCRVIYIRDLNGFQPVTACDFRRIFCHAVRMPARVRVFRIHRIDNRGNGLVGYISVALLPPFERGGVHKGN